jgi:hypothetical protein
MKRFLTVIAATAVAAAVTIPAIADSDQGDPADATFVSCLRTNGIDIPAGTRGFAIKQWLVAHDSPSVNDALKKCAPDAKQGDPVEVTRLIACLKDHGLQPPTDPVALKQWLGEQDGDAVRNALKACGVDIRKDDDRGDAELADCLRKAGANVPPGAEGMTLKNWIRDHYDEPAVADALKRCEMDKPGECTGGDVKPAAPPKAEPTPSLTIQQ